MSEMSQPFPVLIEETLPWHLQKCWMDVLYANPVTACDKLRALLMNIELQENLLCSTHYQIIITIYVSRALLGGSML